jgi:hypothetical protein
MCAENWQQIVYALATGTARCGKRVLKGLFCSQPRSFVRILLALAEIWRGMVFVVCPSRGLQSCSPSEVPDMTHSQGK